MENSGELLGACCLGSQQVPSLASQCGQGSNTAACSEWQEILGLALHTPKTFSTCFPSEKNFSKEEISGIVLSHLFIEPFLNQTTDISWKSLYFLQKGKKYMVSFRPYNSISDLKLLDRKFCRVFKAGPSICTLALCQTFHFHSLMPGPEMVPAASRDRSQLPFCGGNFLACEKMRGQPILMVWP